ncbi:MAG: extracellular catalytic domain type 1 short-chain-length polyhydroxyalkanoate depolymerase, partial [Actinomycetota bacterium]
SYTSIYSLTDPIIQPVAPSPTAALEGASNVAVQDICPGRVVEHLQATWDAVYYAVVLDALTHRGPADPRRIDTSVCTQVAMPGVDASDAIARGAALYAVISQRQAAHEKVAAEPALARYVVVGAETGRSYWGRVTTPAGSRQYALYQPPDPKGRRPLVVYLHGCSERADDTAVASRYSELAAKRGFYVVYPEQPAEANGNLCWNWFLPDHQHRDAGEPSIIAAITRTVMKRFPIDPRRVFVSGVSAGGAMAVVLGATYPDLFAAVGSEAGVEYRGLPCVTVPCVVPPEQAGRWAYEEMGTRARQVPVFAIVGDIDAVSPAMNTEQVIQQWLVTDDWADDGREGSVAREPRRSTAGTVADGYSYTIDRYTNRFGCLLTEHWLVQGMGHVHSGGARDQNYSDPLGPNAAEASYRFFIAHPMQPGKHLRC